MFSSLATFIFGTSTTKEEKSKSKTLNQDDPQSPLNEVDKQTEIDARNTVQVSSLTPSVTGAPSGNVVVVGAVTNGKGKRNKGNRRNRQQHKQAPNEGLEGVGVTPKTSVAELLTSAPDDDFDKDEWLIVSKDGDEIESLPRSDSEEEELQLTVAEVKQDAVSASSEAVSVVAQQQRRRQQLINENALYNGPRHHQQRNYLQRTRNGGSRVATKEPVKKAASVERDVVVTHNLSENELNNETAMTQSLYVGDVYGANASMDESWYVTPPPCFTSIGPINMVTSPFENLLIEHPSMSVYHSIRLAQAGSESFLNVDLGVEDSQRQQEAERVVATRQPLQPQRTNVRIEHFTETQLKQELFARSTQKCIERKERQNMCRGAIKRANKVRDCASKNQRARRSDLQHCKVISGANNNRKICY